jgi:hypothetical protein
MDPEETEARNDCAGKDQQQFNRPTAFSSTAKTLATSRPIANNPLDDCGAVVATCIGNALKRQIQNLRRVAAIES